ncbi:MAG: hypothetical protein P1U83_17215 [Roseovarius sp.]|nr:hypothetical protein [Roseovarius sp.]
MLRYYIKCITNGQFPIKMNDNSDSSAFRHTVGHALSTILPLGTQPVGLPATVAGEPIDTTQASWVIPPILPTDTFAAAGYLCKIGGVVPFFDPSPHGVDTRGGRFTITPETRETLTQEAKKWCDPEFDGEYPFPDAVLELWGVLIDNWDETVTPGRHATNGEGPPDWWSAAFKLVVLSDLACDGVFDGQFRKADSAKRTAMEAWLEVLYQANYRKSSEDDEPFRPPASIAMQADSTIACVMPKARAAAVGATLRNVTRNLCLLPGRGEVRCYWETPMDAVPNENAATLDILLIPEPAKLDATNFTASGASGITDEEAHRDKTDWETFEIDQTWIEGKEKRDEFVESCVKLLLSAKKQSRTVNGIVLPEYALDYEIFDELCERLKDNEPALEFVISGASANCYDEVGNHVLTRIWYQEEGHSLTQSRAKHHRWRMDRSQIENYALGATLNPKIKNWWEDTPLGRRELHFQRFRKASVLSVLICEELARSDPCHEILRAVAPNLIFALLLDGPQIKSRWPAQYAANLADDPGSAVLTFTSFGLIDRCNKQGHFDENRSIALWKDDSGKLVEIQMPKGDGMKGVLLSLWSEHVKDQTLMGHNRFVRAWRYSGHFPISTK